VIIYDDALFGDILNRFRLQPTFHYHITKLEPFTLQFLLKINSDDPTRQQNTRRIQTTSHYFVCPGAIYEESVDTLYLSLGSVMSLILRSQRILFPLCDIA
jgi:hypothetical protein